MVLGCVQKAIAFVTLCSLSKAAEESAVKWASGFKIPEMMHFGFTLCSGVWRALGQTQLRNGTPWPALQKVWL